ncbi:hypothetical protein KCU92_g2457, partial [Aureobasidium melanogenum]
MSTPSGLGVSLSSIRLLYSPMVTVRVGPDRQEFCIHKELLCSKSTYFAKALSGQFLEAQTRIVELEDIHVVLFRVFVAWLYTDKLVYESSNSDASSVDEFRDLDMALQKETPCEAKEIRDRVDDEHQSKGHDLSNFQEKTPESWTYLILVALFVLADRLDVVKFKRRILDAIIKKRTENYDTPNSPAILHAYANTTRNSMLRRLLVHIVAYDEAFTPAYTAWTHLPVDFLAAVLVTLGRRMPGRQCSDCFAKAFIENNLATTAVDDMREDEDLSPFRRDLCFYHEHKDEEEKDACVAAREEESDSE